MRKSIYPLCIILLVIYSCGPKKVNEVSYEDATKWHSNCDPYPNFHPGDWYAYEDICAKKCNVTIVPGIAFHELLEERTSLPSESSRDSSSSIYGVESEEMYTERINELKCIRSCIENIHPIATHVEGGYYSDGSYYARCRYKFENIHTTRNKYQKTQWKTERDECMQLTAVQIKQGFCKDTSSTEYWKCVKRFYRECLNERGSSMMVY